jgi:Tol biopolymer transport system component
MHTDGTSQVQLTKDGTSAWPAFSPDGRSIAFAHGTTTTGTDIWVMNADGTSPRPLTTTGLDWGPNWR